jgi:hypothetical protein
VYRCRDALLLERGLRHERSATTAATHIQFACQILHASFEALRIISLQLREVKFSIAPVCAIWDESRELVIKSRKAWPPIVELGGHFLAPAAALSKCGSVAR